MKIARVCLVFHKAEQDPLLGNARGELTLSTSGGHGGLEKSYKDEKNKIAGGDWEHIHTMAVRHLDTIIQNRIGENARIISVNENVTDDKATFIFWVQG